MWGLVMETLHRTGQVDPESLLSLPDDWVRMHLAHTRNHFIAQYDPQTSGGKKEMKPGEAMQAVNKWRQQRALGPTDADVRAAREAIELGDLVPEAVTQAAVETLRWAGRI